ncbi:hypothetical protein [Pediococcus acidilactici]|uniref:hypothetical protein n=3 Tax=Pediococcus acidilactici TaxID=1254 RepID=UPI0029356988|nr:hypothetical protein [Pediococcus acidilactici]MDV2844376.1 hypothetical protein [Pediococcus acidilactici]WQS22053.1 hypothetical protein SGW15_08060 [Pediococcus acidilactici]WQS27361.1 hypothetical protein SGW11_01005 [Pediococcus acidilactici]
MKTLLIDLFKRTQFLFFPVLMLEIISKIVMKLQNSSQLIMLHTIWIMLAAFFLIIYSVRDLFKLIFTRNQFFYYSMKYKPTTILFLKSLMYIFMNYLFYLVYVPQINIEAIYKFEALFTFYMLNAAILMLLKSIKANSLVYIIAVILILGIIVTGFMTYFYSQMPHWMIGANDYHSAKQVYLTIIPITFLGLAGDYSKVIHSAIEMNGLLSTLGLGIFIYANKLKANW